MIKTDFGLDYIKVVREQSRTEHANTLYQLSLHTATVTLEHAMHIINQHKVTWHIDTVLQECPSFYQHTIIKGGERDHMPMYV